MPSKSKSKTNVSKSAAAMHQCNKAIKSAAEGAAGLQFYSVQKALGNAFFSLRNAEGKEIRGTPRGLFTCGTMRVSVGQIVVAEGDSRGLEIVGVIKERSEAEALVKAGAMNRNVLAHASSAGQMLSPVVEDELFEAPEGSEDESESRANKNDLAAKSSVNSMAARFAAKSGKVKGVRVENSAIDLSATASADAEQEAFGRTKRAKTVSAPRLSIPMRPALVSSVDSGPSIWDNAMSVETEEKMYSTELKLSQRPDLPSWDEVDIDAI